MPIMTFIMAITLGVNQSPFQYDDTLVEYRKKETYTICAVCPEPTPKTIQKVLPITIPKLSGLPQHMATRGGQDLKNSIQGSLPTGTTAQKIFTVAAASAVVSVQCDVFSESVFFEFNAASLGNIERSTIDRLLAKAKSVKKVFLTGFTDSVGSSAYNNALALKRAEAVRNYLMEKGVKAEIIEFKGYGKCCYDGDDKNSRRVEIRLFCEK